MLKGSKHSPESLAKMREKHLAIGSRPPSRLGVPNTEEQKAKIRATHLERGVKPPVMYGDDNPSRREEVRAKISAKHKGKILSPEHREMLSKNHRKFNPESMRGKNSHLWKGGISPINRRIRESAEYKIWRKAIYERDDYTCQNCGQRGGILNADHIKPFSLYPELRFELSNGRTLCKPCHLEIGWKGSHVQNQTKQTA